MFKNLHKLKDSIKLQLNCPLFRIFLQVIEIIHIGDCDCVHSRDILTMKTFEDLLYNYYKSWSCGFIYINKNKTFVSRL